MENNVVKKRGFLGGWDAVVIVGILLIGSNILENHFYNKNELKKKAKNGKEASREASVVSTISRRRGLSEVEGRSRRERHGREKSWRNI